MRQMETRQTKRIKQVSVTNLFGIFNHVIPLNMDERITIIHGPNGFGKTMILKLLKELFSTKNSLLFSIPFDEFKVDFEDGTSFWIKKTPRHTNSSESFSSQEIIFQASGESAYIVKSARSLRSRSWENSIVPSQSLSQIKDYIPFLQRVDSHIWQDTSSGELLSLQEVIERYNELLPVEVTGKEGKLPEWLVNIRKSISIHFIETQRLQIFSEYAERDEFNEIEFPEYVVAKDSRHLCANIREKLAESAALSQSLDRTFPGRLLSPSKEQQQITEHEILDKLERLEQKRTRLMSVGLLDREMEAGLLVNAEHGIEQDKMSVLAIYADDTEKKLQIFDELANKIALLTSVINNRFLYKEMTVNKEQGIVLTNKNGEPLSLESLSSGEQHELVLFYELLFRVNPGSLILIDEPEISLHIVWQEQFLKDVKLVTQLSDIDVILATHSPDIISDRKDLLVELGEPANGRV